MTDAETERPPILLCLYALSNMEGWQRVSDLQSHIEAHTDARPARSTLTESLIELRVAGRIEYRKTVRNGSETTLYRTRNTTATGG